MLSPGDVVRYVSEMPCRLYGAADLVGPWAPGESRAVVADDVAPTAKQITRLSAHRVLTDHPQHFEHIPAAPPPGPVKAPARKAAPSKPKTARKSRSKAKTAAPE